MYKLFWLWTSIDWIHKKQDNDSNSLKSWSKRLHHIVKSNRTKQWFSIKVATFWNNKKKDWFSHKTRLVFMHGNIFKNGSWNSATFKMELFATFGNGRVYNQWVVVFACCCGNSTVFTGKIKIRWKWRCLEGGIRYDFLIYRHVFAFFWKHQFLFH